MNLREYVWDSPVSRTDPSGLQAPISIGIGQPPAPRQSPTLGGGKNKKRFTEGYLCASLCSDFAHHNTGIPAGRLPPGVSPPHGPPGGGNHTSPYPGNPPAPIGGGGADPCIILVVKCAGFVSVFHFYAGLDSPGRTLRNFSWPPGCSALVCGGNRNPQSRCAADEVVREATDRFNPLTVAIGKSRCGVGADGEWYVEK